MSSLYVKFLLKKTGKKVNDYYFLKHMNKSLNDHPYQNKIHVYESEYNPSISNTLDKYILQKMARKGHRSSKCQNRNRAHLFQSCIRSLGRMQDFILLKEFACSLICFEYNSNQRLLYNMT